MKYVLVNQELVAQLQSYLSQQPWREANGFITELSQSKMAEVDEKEDASKEEK